MKEVEIKARVREFATIEKKLIELGCVLSEPIRQEDVIYGRPENNIYEKGKEHQIAIRIRENGGKFELTAKYNLSNELDNIEHELEIGNNEEMHKILELMGWQPVVTVKKFRRKGKLGEYEICLDNVDELGNFIELEKLCEEGDSAKIIQDLMSTLETLGVAKENRVLQGYDTLMYNKTHGNR